MAGPNGRRSRRLDSDDEDFSRETTPLSTAPNDRKRIRRSAAGEISSPTSERSPLVGQNGLSARNRTTDGGKRIRKHQPGAIVRVKLTNFVTYTSAEFFPGPNLNMVIGPNGTGKSTLVCAICLGLGFPPTLLGRAKEANEFVKHGSKEATIEIELQRAETGENATAKNPVIRHKIRKEDNKLQFWIGGSHATRAQVKDVVGAYNIQVDNLCQFLPQDRVVEFAQMSPVQMLEETLKAAAEPEVLDNHARLKDLRKSQQEFMNNSKGDKETLDNLQKRQEAQRPAVERLEERMRVQHQINDFEKCRPIGEYQECVRKWKALKKRKEELEVETMSLEQESEPVLRKVNGKQRYALEAKKNRDNHKSQVTRAEADCKRIEVQINTAEERMKDCTSREEAERSAARSDKQKLDKFKTDLRVLNAKKDEPPEPFDSRAANERIQQHRQRMRELQQKIDDLQAEANAIQTRGKDMTARKRELERSIEDLQTQQGQQEQKLHTISPDSAKAWKWIKENQEKFKMEVLGPPAVTCTVKDPRMANTVEAVLQQSDFRVFTVQCQEDFRLLQEELLRNQKLFEISIYTCTARDLSAFKSPTSDEALRQYGLQGWAIDFIQGPPTVLAMLCQTKFLHQVGVSREDVTSDQHDRIAASNIKGYVAGRSIVRFTRRAEYGDAGTAARRDEVRNARFWTDQPVDTGRRQQLSNEIKAINRELYEMKESRDTLQAEAVKLDREKDSESAQAEILRKEKDAKQKIQSEWNGLDTKITQLQAKVDSYDANAANVRERIMQIRVERDDAMFERAEFVLKYCEAAHALKQQSTKLLQAEVMYIEAQSDFENLRDRHQHIADTLKMKKEEYEIASLETTKAREEGSQKAKTVRQLKAEADGIASNGDDSLSNLIAELSQDKDVSEKTIEDQIVSLQNQLELVSGGVEDQNTIRDFEVRQKRIDKLIERMARVEGEQRNYIDSIKQIRQSFEEELAPIVGKIDQAFGESFARIGCAGQVAVYKASSDDPADCTELMGGTENGLDFANWAIHISVKFRESEPLSLLDSHRQSGGERAVSTIFYLMALQSLSRSPFRVVDEINQGMDPRNERMVHGRMVDIAADNERLVAAGKSAGSQYFLITPKLLSGLKYERGMTVLCIVSGENMPSASDTVTRDDDGKQQVEKARKIDFGAFVKRARELGLNSGHDRVSGVGRDIAAFG